jgi:hypothetical protein
MTRQGVPYRGVVSAAVGRVHVVRVGAAHLDGCRVVSVGGMVAGHHVHAEDPGDDCEHRRRQGATLQERLEKTRIK